uniref:Uncharacterized protein n=1 Tax=Ditylenchus dipsaci TaxID=166011 RepID=A0A915DHT6_9BILA
MADGGQQSGCCIVCQHHTQSIADKSALENTKHAAQSDESFERLQVLTSQELCTEHGWLEQQISVWLHFLKSSDALELLFHQSTIVYQNSSQVLSKFITFPFYQMRIVEYSSGL